MHFITFVLLALLAGLITALPAELAPSVANGVNTVVSELERRLHPIKLTMKLGLLFRWSMGRPRQQQTR